MVKNTREIKKKVKKKGKKELEKERINVKYNLIGIRNNVMSDIFHYLRDNRGKKFNARQIKNSVGHGYPAVLKYVDILEARGLIKVENYGNVKLIWFEEFKDERREC